MEWIFRPNKRVYFRHWGDRVENAQWRAIDLPLPSPVKNVVILYQTNNITIDTLRDIANCIISIDAIIQRRSGGIDVSVCGLIPLDEPWLVNMGFVNEANETFKYWCIINGFTFVF